ncbi:RNA methyltransferase [Pricia sp. S334]|uniref:RNA methyltransferase n=1 Tax=Pricia mediterranea TaxID=3076079 RepID=A0ABU3L884_9FLAO|nr:RNA methyltransferase [Pricia sp. S334]MDT7829960.1 RNA methyltransferase [Pricia sp. S334]
MKEIQSLQNPLVKKIGVLQNKSRERKKTGLFVLEGLRELQLAVKGNYFLDTILFQDGMVSEDKIRKLTEAFETPPQIVRLSKEVYGKLAYRKTTEGVLALVHDKSHSLETLSLATRNPLILIAEAPEKPGNIGALLRTADAAGLDAILIANPKTDLYNPNTIRSSVGCIFTNNIAVGSTSEIISFLKRADITCYCADLAASTTYTEVDFNAASAIVVGTEATGLSREWLDNSDQNIIIPMAGEIDSMNVSVSAAILIFEAKRQRGELRVRR